MKKRVMSALIIPSVLAACLCGAVVQRAGAQTLSNVPTPIPTPDQSLAIPLGTSAASSAQPEQWEVFNGSRTVRNVTVATLTPVLPDPAKANGAAVIVAPGGGFIYLVYDDEGYREARWLADRGITAFVLKYRLRDTSRDPETFVKEMYSMMRGAGRPAQNAAKASTPNVGTTTTASPANRGPMASTDAVEDAKAAVRLVRSRAAELHIDPNRVGFLGFSAGALTTLEVGMTDDKASRPDFIAPIYGDMSARDIPDYAPPVFLAIATNDPLLGIGRDFGLIDSYRKAHKQIEAHLYIKGGHGFGMSHRSDSSALWIDEFYAWMSDLGVLKSTH